MVNYVSFLLYWAVRQPPRHLVHQQLLLPGILFTSEDLVPSALSVNFPDNDLVSFWRTLATALNGLRLSLLRSLSDPFGFLADHIPVCSSEVPLLRIAPSSGLFLRPYNCPARRAVELRVHPLLRTLEDLF